MAFGPRWNSQTESGEESQHDDAAILSLVRTAAEELVADLNRAEKLTDGWSDEKLTDVLTEAALSRCLALLATTNLWGEANRLPSSELWRVAGPILESGVLQTAARFKPHGYAGDFEMLDRICRDYRCDHPLGRALDRYFQLQAAPRAVRSRTRQTSAALVDHCLRLHGGEYRVTSVGSGPAIDVYEAILTLPERRLADLKVTLLDLDPNGLEFAQRRIEPLLPPGALRCTRTNLFRLPRQSDAADTLGNPHFLVCAGLFDYLDDEVAAAMLQFFTQQLHAGGLLLVGNFAPHNPSRAYMEWIGNWYLTYRTAQEMHDMGLRANIPDSCFTITSEQLGVDLFLISQKDQTY